MAGAHMATVFSPPPLQTVVVGFVWYVLVPELYHSTNWKGADAASRGVSMPGNMQTVKHCRWLQDGA